MEPDERFDWLVIACLLMLGIGAMFQSSMNRLLADKMLDIDADVRYLKDNTIARETEARP
jgi:hypothetical protein